MTKKPDRSYLQPYEDATRRQGAGFGAQLWMSVEAQQIRFRVLDELGRLGGRVVVDLGCGQGDFALYLFEKHQKLGDGFPKSFIGIEGVFDMADLARGRLERAGVAHALIEQGDFVADESLPDLLVSDAGAEVFVFSGSLNTLPIERAISVLDHFWSALERFGRGTMIFNFLSDRHNPQRTPANPPAVRFDPAVMLDWALKQTPLVRLRHDYLKGHDATIVMDVVSNAD